MNAAAVRSCNLCSCLSRSTLVGGLPPRSRAHELVGQQLTHVDKVLKPFHLAPEKLKEMSRLLEEHFQKGLGKDRHDVAEVKMLPIFIRNIPTGTETGDFLALDLGGTNVRVLYVRLEDNVQSVLYKKQEPIPEDIRTGTTCEKLFNHIADFVADFLAEVLKKLEPKEKVLPLGFSCSFPCEQTAIDKAMLIEWSKGFAYQEKDVDVLQLLKNAIMKKEESEEVNFCQVYKIEPVAVLNDAVGTMMSCAYQDQSCLIGIIIGTGTNACYMEEMSNVELIQGDEGEMCINTEWPSFGDNGCLQHIQTEFDKVVDGSSDNKGCHIFEKMISGMYLGELTRLLLVDMAEKKLLFGGEVSKALSEKGRFETSYISAIERENTGLQRAQQILTDLGLSSKPEDCEIVRRICETISSRSAHLCGAALATIVKRIHNNRGLSQITVGVDGSVYRNHPYYRDRLGEMVKMLAPPNCIVRYATTEDASGKGAAVVAAMAKRHRRRRPMAQPINFQE